MFVFETKLPKKQFMKYLAFTLLTLFVVIFVQTSSAQTDVADLTQKAEDFDRQNKFTEAINEISKAIAAQPSDAKLYLRRAQFNFDAGKHEAVADDASKAAALEPSNKLILFDAARLLRYTKHCDESLRLLDDFISQNVAGDDVYYSRSHSKMCREDWAGAYEDMYKASELAPGNNMYRSTLAGMLTQIVGSEKALEQFAQLIKFYEKQFAKAKIDNPKITENHSLSEVYELRARAYHSRNDITAEFADLAKFIEYEPKDGNYRQRALAYLDHDMPNEAIADYTEALKNTLNPAIFLFERGDCFNKIGKYAEAISDYEEAIKKDSSIREVAIQRIIAAKRKIQPTENQPR